MKKFWPVLLVLAILATACADDGAVKAEQLGGVTNNNSYIDSDARNDQWGSAPTNTPKVEKSCGFLGLACEPQKATNATNKDLQDFNSGVRQYRDNASPAGDLLGISGAIEHPGKVRECDISTNPPTCVWKDR